MKERFRNMFQQMLLIAFGVTCSLALWGGISELSGHSLTFSFRHLLSILVAGVACPWTSLILEKVMNKPRKQYLMGIVLHFFLTMGIVMLLGFLFEWYTETTGAIAVLIDYVIIYVFVWAGTYWAGLLDQRKINSALDDIRDEE